MVNRFLMISFSGFYSPLLLMKKLKEGDFYVTFQNPDNFTGIILYWFWNSLLPESFWSIWEKDCRAI